MAESTVRTGTLITLMLSATLVIAAVIVIVGLLASILSVLGDVGAVLGGG